MKRKPMQKHKSSWKKTLEEIELTWQGRLVYVDAKYAVDGTVWPGCRQTHWEPEEPASIDLGDETIVVTQVTDAESLDAIELTDELNVAALAAVAAYVKAHASEFEQEFLQEEDDRDEGAYWEAVDRAIDERKERGL